MWRPDIVDLSQFYSAAMGQVVRRQLRRELRATWPDIKGQRLLGLGYATPFLRPFMAEAERVIAVMPANQGIQRWPRDEPNRVLLADETELPLADESVDRVILVHVLETAESIRPLLREVWRVLSSDGRALFVVPNRRGLWSRAEHTPFGHGHPYTPGQLVRLLKGTMFQPEHVRTCLHLPPFGWRPILRANHLFERVGPHLWPRFAGLVMIEAGKQIYAVTPTAERSRRRRIRVAPALAPAARSSECQTPQPPPRT